MQTLTWQEVVKIHRTIRGVSTRDGVVSSILISIKDPTGYADQINGNEIRYMLPPTRRDRRDLDAMERTMMARCPVRVFEKLEPDCWVELGLFTVVGIEPEANKDSAAVQLRRATGAAAAVGR